MRVLPSVPGAVTDGSHRVLHCAGRTLPLDRTRVMGVLNLTPDSFSDGGRLYARGELDLGAIRATAEQMLEAGADLLDIGGESTRPGALPVPLGRELSRVMPALELLLNLGAMVSVDTRKAGVARAAIQLGGHLINDVSGLADPAMVQVLAESDVGVCIMHMSGTPRTMQNDPRYADVVADVRKLLKTRAKKARAAGIDAERLCLDPGFGFGKTLDHNLMLLKNLDALRVDDLPILVGLSRKRMLGSLTGREVNERLAGSVTAAVLAAERGADIVRVHDVAETVDALKVMEAVTR